MSDFSQGPGWWQASDGKWYPPEQAPGGAPVGPPAGYGAPAGAPPGYPTGTAFGAPGAPGMPGVQLVEWPQRVVAYLVDAGIVIVAFLAVFLVALVFSAINDNLGALVLLIGYVAMLGAGFYFAYLTGVKGQSPGKALIGIKVVSEDTGQPIGGGQGIVRQLAHFLDGICLIGYLFPLWDPKKQTFADKIMKTVVVNGPKSDFGPAIFKA